MLANLKANQKEIGRIAREMQALCECAIAPDPAVLADARWRFARQVLTTVTLHDQLIYAHLEQSPDTGVAAIVIRFREEQEALHILFRDHMLRWPGDAVQADWHGYRHTVIKLYVLLFDRLRREEEELYPLALRELRGPIEKHRGARNWARDAWDIRDAILDG